jgi:phosphoenolpyruvate carboxykinase (ATP)
MSEHHLNLTHLDITSPTVIRNPSPAKLYELALHFEEGSAISSTGALIAMSGAKTGRSPKDKRIVREPGSADNIWWGPVNIELSEESFLINRERAVDYLNTRKRLYVIDAFAGHDPRYRLKIRVVCARAYHALFMYTMLIRPTEEELESYGEPDYLILNAGQFPANSHTEGMTSKTSVALNFRRREFIILGSEYAGEMKKGVFTIMNYLMPLQGVLSMHCSVNENPKDADDVSVFFGLSGTGKTTLSADPHRSLIGDDEHCWSDEGVFNIEGGCYAKMVNLSAEAEPDIYNAIRFGAVLENVRYDPHSRKVDFADISLTENTRGAYPLEYINNAKIPAVGKHPRNIIFLTCDAFGVLPPVSLLTPGQAMYHFISGYTAKVAGTEQGVTEPQGTFSACFGAPFLVWHPTKYAELLAAKMRKHNARVWLVNTGWSGGPYGVGSRMKLRFTRAIIDAIHNGSLAQAPTAEDPIFGLTIPQQCEGVPTDVLNPRSSWTDKAAYDATARKLAGLFHQNFEEYAPAASPEVLAGAPKVWDKPAGAKSKDLGG